MSGSVLSSAMAESGTSGIAVVRAQVLEAETEEVLYIRGRSLHGMAASVQPIQLLRSEASILRGSARRDMQ